MSGMRADVAPELVKKVASVYLYVFRTLVDATREKSVKLVDDVLRVLEVERGTWQLVCERLGAAQTGDGQAGRPCRSADPAHRRRRGRAAARPGFSLEA